MTRPGAATALTAALLVLWAVPLPAQLQSPTEGDETAQAPPEQETENRPEFEVRAGPPRDALTGQAVAFGIDTSTLEEGTVREILWDFGDGVRATGGQVTHAYRDPGSYLVKIRVATDRQTMEDTTEVRVFEHLIILIADQSVPTEEIEIHKQRAAREDILLLSRRAKGGAPEVLTEEELTASLIDIRGNINDAHLIVMWTSGGVGTNVLSKFAQHIRQSEGISEKALGLENKGIVLLSETPFGLLKPAAQSVFDQLQPSYVLLGRPALLDILLATKTAEEARSTALSSPLDYRLLGTFSTRTVSDLGITNFMSFGINYLVNRGVPINSIILILMLPVVATILTFARQVIGIQAFGLITPAMTTLSFLVMGLRYGLIVFIAILLAGTLTRAIVRKLRLLYLPRMALVLTSVSLSLLLLLAAGAANDKSSVLSFSIFPALILTILAEEFISAQFKQGVRSALTITAWTLALAMICYFIVSSDLFRTLILSYPEVTLLAIPINVVLGHWSGLRLTEYLRFRALLRNGRSTAK